VAAPSDYERPRSTWRTENLNGHFLSGISVRANAISDRFFLFRIVPSRASRFSDLD
jgi:hypothetical protein